MLPELHSKQLAPSRLAARIRVDATLCRRWLIFSLPLAILLSWIVTLLAGDGYLDALGNPVGGDFAMFAIAGQMAWQGEWSDLYNEPLQQARLLELIPALPEGSYLPYRYPPLIAMVMAPFALLPFPIAFCLFTCLSVSVWLLAICGLMRTCLPRADETALTAVMAIAAAPVMIQTLIDGQASVWWFAVAAACWCCLERQRPVMAGCCLALAACKPNVLLLLGIVLVLRHPRMLIGIVATGSLMLVTTVLVCGTNCLAAYVELSQHLAISRWSIETPYWKVQSLLSWTELLLGPLARRINLLLGLLSATAIGLWWRRQPRTLGNDARGLCCGLLVNALFNPYTPVYDMTVLCLGAFACVAAVARAGVSAEWLERRDVQASLLLIVLGPIFSQAIAKAFSCPLQLMPLCLIGLCIYWCVMQRTRLFFRPDSQRTSLATGS